MRMPKFTKAMIEYEYGYAVAKHGAKFDSYEEGYKALLEEVAELKAAIYRNDIEGRHGIQREASQVAAVCVKFIGGVGK